MEENLLIDKLVKCYKGEERLEMEEKLLVDKRDTGYRNRESLEIYESILVVKCGKCVTRSKERERKKERKMRVLQYDVHKIR